MAATSGMAGERRERERVGDFLLFLSFLSLHHSNSHSYSPTNIQHMLFELFWCVISLKLQFTFYYSFVFVVIYIFLKKPLPFSMWNWSMVTDRNLSSFLPSPPLLAIAGQNQHGPKKVAEIFIAPKMAVFRPPPPYFGCKCRRFLVSTRQLWNYTGQECWNVQTDVVMYTFLEIKQKHIDTRLLHIFRLPHSWLHNT